MKHTGCPCGCLNGVDCITERPLPIARQCCGLGFEEIAACGQRGLFCGAGRCARQQLQGAA